MVHTPAVLALEVLANDPAAAEDVADRGRGEVMPGDPLALCAAREEFSGRPSQFGSVEPVQHHAVHLPKAAQQATHVWLGCFE